MGVERRRRHEDRDKWDPPSHKLRESETLFPQGRGEAGTLRMTGRYGPQEIPAFAGMTRPMCCVSTPRSKPRRGLLCRRAIAGPPVAPKVRHFRCIARPRPSVVHTLDSKPVGQGAPLVTKPSSNARNACAEPCGRANKRTLSRAGRTLNLTNGKINRKLCQKTRTGINLS